MENEDVIEVMTAQIGGGGRLKGRITTQGSESADDKMSFVVNAVEVGGKLINEMHFSIRPNVKVKDFMNAWSKGTGCALDEVVFRFNPDKEGPGLPFESEDETFGDVSRARTNVVTAFTILISNQTGLDPEGQIFVSAFIDEPANLVRARGDIPTSEVNTGPGAPEETVCITITPLYLDEVKREMHCKMSQNMPFGRLIDLYSNHWNVDASAQRFSFQGKTVFPSDTPISVSHVLFLAHSDQRRAKRLRFPTTIISKALVLVLEFASSEDALLKSDYLQFLRLAQGTAQSSTSQRIPMSSLWISLSTKRHSSSRRPPVQRTNLCSTTKLIEHGNNGSHDISKTRTTDLTKRRAEKGSKILVLCKTPQKI
jgi:hypothetical protein